VKAESFSTERIRDPALRQLMQRIRIEENPRFTRQYPSKLVTEIEVLARHGEKLALRASYPKGHAHNPLSDSEVDLKFMSLCEPLMDLAQREALLGALHEIDRMSDISRVIDLLQIRQ
jgi:2-methylcitrate dehydratase